MVYEDYDYIYIYITLTEMSKNEIIKFSNFILILSITFFLPLS